MPWPVNEGELILRCGGCLGSPDGGCFGDNEIRRWCQLGWLLWGLVLPVLLVVAGVITIRRRRRGR
jgi:hypothetical protein